MLVNGSIIVCASLNNGVLLLNLVGLVDRCCLLFLTQTADPQSKQIYWPGLYTGLVLACALPPEETGFATRIKYMPVAQRRSAFLPLCSQFLLTGWPNELVHIFGLFALHHTVAKTSNIGR